MTSKTAPIFLLLLTMSSLQLSQGKDGLTIKNALVKKNMVEGAQGQYGLTINQVVVINDKEMKGLKSEAEGQDSLTMNQVLLKIDMVEREMKGLKSEVQRLEDLTTNQSLVIEKYDVKVQRLEALSTKRFVDMLDTIAKQYETINDSNVKVSEVKTKLGHLESFTANQSIVLGDLYKKDSYQSIFSAGYNTKDTIRHDVPVVFSNVLTNIGDNYDSKTGLYTAPVDGFYVFHLVVRTTLRGAYIKVYLEAEANEELAVVHASGSSDQSSSSTVVKLYKGQRVKAMVGFNGGYKMAESPYSMFTGFLLKPL